MCKKETCVFNFFLFVLETDGPSEAVTAYINAYEGQDIEREFTDRKYSSHVVHPGIGLVMATQVTNFNKSFKQMLSTDMLLLFFVFPLPSFAFVFLWCRKGLLCTCL